jgi:hypothetical protein
MRSTIHAVSFAAAMLACVSDLGSMPGEARHGLPGAQSNGQTLPQPNVPLQPLAQQVRRLEAALSYLGQPLAAGDHQEIDQAVAATDEEDAVRRLQTTLDRYVLAFVEISAEGRVKVERGPAAPELIEAGTRVFLVKVFNQANVTAPLRVESPNTGSVYIRSNGSPEPNKALTQRDVRERWANISIYDKPPMPRRLSGLAVEYVILEVFSRDSGQRAAEIAFNVGQGSQDIGFRNDISVVFTARPTRPITLRVRDENARPAFASLVIRDRFNQIHPSPAKRLAPDFFFQPQVYRRDGESVSLPAGDYTIAFAAGPEYLSLTKTVHVDAAGPPELALTLERWIDPAKLGWYSGDHHIHAAGCSHYQNPTEGVLPEDMIRQIQGEALNLGSVLTWGPCYYYQKQFFTGEDSGLSKPDRLMHYDLEVSGFPSSHSGHLVLLGLKDQDYPKTHRIEDWPSWDLPILKWAKSQGAVVGFAHSGWGLDVQDRQIPSFEMPAFDGIGANEYIVDVTHPGAVDFISAMDTPPVAELSIWYHTLNVGFRTRISGETDFPCIYDARVGIGRTYSKVDGSLTFEGWLTGMRTGRSYVSDGKSHLFDFTVNGLPAGQRDSELALNGARSVHVQLRAAAYLDAVPNEEIRARMPDQKPYWDLERARIGKSREVPVELIVNGAAVASKNIVADGQVKDVSFDVAIGKSSWIAVRILPSSHTNPVFALVDGRPIRASHRSAEWCLTAVNQCWTQKAPAIRPAEREEARAAYDHARDIYKRLIAESSSSR